MVYGVWLCSTNVTWLSLYSWFLYKKQRRHKEHVRESTGRKQGCSDLDTLLDMHPLTADDSSTSLKVPAPSSKVSSPSIAADRDIPSLLQMHALLYLRCIRYLRCIPWLRMSLFVSPFFGDEIDPWSKEARLSRRVRVSHGDMLRACATPCLDGLNDWFHQVRLLKVGHQD